MDNLFDCRRSWDLLLLLGTLLVYSQTAWCASHNHSPANQQSQTQSLTDTATSQRADTPLYSCPMHPEETSQQPGRCSICGMFLVGQELADGHEKTQHIMHADPVQNDSAMHNDHQHHTPAQTYVCPMHPEETSQQPGRCSLCGMFLVEQGKHDNPMHHGSGMQSEPKQHETGMHMMKQPSAASNDVKPAAMNHAMSNGMLMPAKPKAKRFWETSRSQQTNNDHPHRNKDDSLLEIAKRPQRSPNQKTEASHSHNGSTYICPMHPQITSKDADASCPICGMDLVLKSSALQQDGEPQVFLPSNVIQNMGIRTALAKHGSIKKSLKTQGIVTADDERIHNIHPRTGGWIERLYPITEGDRVERKEELVDFYSPWINQVQLEFITALEEYDLISYDPTRKTELDAKVDSLRNRLRLLNVTPMELMRIEKSRKVLSTIQIKAPQGGWITDLSVTEGTYVEPYQAMFTIVDLSEVWIMVDIFEHQAPWVRKGQEVEITTATAPGRVWAGKIDFIYPEVNPKTRTLRARIEVSNPDEALLLNMFVQVDLSHSSGNNHAVTVPRESIIVTGEREIIVKSLGKGHFQPEEVTSGIWGDDRVEILAGIEDGDEIVVSGQFLIDSESNIQSSLLRMSE